MHKNVRNYGIDLLRVLATNLVIILHLMAYGGIQARAMPFTASYNLMWFVAIAAYCSVNCFALISGFLAYDKEFHCTNILRLHLTVLYHGILITWILRCIFPESVAHSDVLRSLRPIAHRTYWYYSVYAVLFFLIPLLRRIMKKTGKPWANLIILTGVFLFSVIPTVTGRDYFAINGGFSLPWLTLLCFIGMYLKKYHEELCHHPTRLTAFFFGCTGITWLLKFALELWAQMPYGMALNTAFLTTYCSPPILFASIALVLLFSSLQIPAWKRKVLPYMVSLTFSVYIIHEHPLVRQLLIRDSMLFVFQYPAVIQVVIVLFTAVAVWLVCSGFDWIRKTIFDIVQIDKGLRFLETHICRRGG